MISIIKRALTVVTAGLLLFSLAACSGGGEAHSAVSPGSSGSSDNSTVDSENPEKDEVFESVLNTIKTYPTITDTSYYDFSGLGEFKLGAYFWYGFSYTGDHYTDRLLQEFSDREPVWGWTNSTVENMEQQIAYATAAGIAYFAFDWYNANSMAQSNSCVDNFLASSNNKKMEFCLNVCNHEGAYVTADNWEYAAETWLKYMREDNYLKVDNKPVLMFFSSYYLQYYLGGADGCQKAFDWLEAEVKKLGYDGVLIIGSECPYGSPGTRDIDFNEANYNEVLWKNLVDQRRQQGFAALTGYNYRRYSPLTLSDGSKTYNAGYELLAKDHETCWDRFSDQKMPYVPCVLGGWDCRPWETNWSGNATGYQSCYAADRTPKMLYNHILNAAKWLDKNKDCSVGNLAVLYAWNETCEGGYISPTKGDDGRLLGAVRQAIMKINGSVEE